MRYLKRFAVKWTDNCSKVSTKQNKVDVNLWLLKIFENLLAWMKGKNVKFNETVDPNYKVLFDDSIFIFISKQLSFWN